MHKGTRHVGKVPEALRQSRDLSDRLKLLQKKLNKAIEQEDFEQAAVLRDEIKQASARADQLATHLMRHGYSQFSSSRRPRPRAARARTTGSSCPAASGWRATSRMPPFPAGPRSRSGFASWNCIRPAVEALPEMKERFPEAMDNLSALDKQILVERHLISREHAAKSAGSGLVLNRDETLCFMINEEDHLRMQALRPGLQLRQAWTTIDQADSALEKKLELRLQPRTRLPDRLPDQPRHRHPGQRHAAPARAWSWRSRSTRSSNRSTSSAWPSAAFTARAPRRWAMFSRCPTR